MANKKDKMRKDALKKKVMIETLKFQARWGFKKLYGDPSPLWSILMDKELDIIVELDLQEDLLAIKGFVDDVRSALGAEPVEEFGDFRNSLVALSLGIGRLQDINTMSMPVEWHELIDRKLLSIYYPDDIRNEVAEHAKTIGYNTSTYLGQPIVKFKHFSLKLDRSR